MPKTIIVPLDGSHFAERALAPARVLAEQSDATLLLAMSRLGGADDPERYLDAAAHRAGVGAHRTAVFADHLAATVVPIVADSEPDPIICMTTHGRSGPGVTLFGSIAEQILHRTDVPIALIGPAVRSTPPEFRELALCLDGSERAAAMLDHSATLARDLRMGLWLIHVADPQWQQPTGPVDDDTTESAMLQHAASRVDASHLSVNWETLHGEHVARTIVEFAMSRPAPILAMATNGRGGVGRLFCGSVTMSVVHHAPCPVLVAHTRGFER